MGLDALVRAQLSADGAAVELVGSPSSGLAWQRAPLAGPPEARAIPLQNGTRYGLAAGVWTRDLNRAHRFVRDLESGAVWVNTYRKIHWAVPFGGVKESGYGRDSGWESVLENTRLKTSWIEIA